MTSMFTHGVIDLNSQLRVCMLHLGYGCKIHTGYTHMSRGSRIHCDITTVAYRVKREMQISKILLIYSPEPNWTEEEVSILLSNLSGVTYKNWKNLLSFCYQRLSKEIVFGILYYTLLAKASALSFGPAFMRWRLIGHILSRSYLHGSMSSSHSGLTERYLCSVNAKWAKRAWYWNESFYCIRNSSNNTCGVTWAD